MIDYLISLKKNINLMLIYMIEFERYLEMRAKNFTLLALRIDSQVVLPNLQDQGH